MVKVDISNIIECVGSIQPFYVIVNAQEIGETEPWVQGDISVSGQVVNLGTMYRLIGNVTAKAAFECVRCLATFEQPASFQFEEDFDGADFGSPDGWINIAEPIRAALIFQEPMKPLCSEKCKGLCVYCGIDRNKADCDCDKTRIDPRLAELRRLLEK